MAVTIMVDFSKPPVFAFNWLAETYILFMFGWL